MKILGITGWSGAGKTTLIEALIPRLAARGLAVSTVKHAHHGFDMDRPGKDSHRHRMAGAREVLVSGAGRWALLRENPDGAEPALADLLARLAPVDLVLVEGFKAAAHPKLEVWRPAHGKSALWPGRSDIVAVATDALHYPPDLARAGGPAVLELGDIDAIVGWVLRYIAMPATTACRGAATP